VCARGGGVSDWPTSARPAPRRRRLQPSATSPHLTRRQRPGRYASSVPRHPSQRDRRKSPPSVVHPAASPPTHAQLLVTLSDSDPLVWRRLAVPSTTTLAKLHRVLQVTLGWTDSHLH